MAEERGCFSWRACCLGGEKDLGSCRRFLSCSVLASPNQKAEESRGSEESGEISSPLSSAALRSSALEMFFPGSLGTGVQVTAKEGLGFLGALGALAVKEPRVLIAPLGLSCPMLASPNQKAEEGRGTEEIGGILSLLSSATLRSSALEMFFPGSLGTGVQVTAKEGLGFLGALGALAVKEPRILIALPWVSAARCSHRQINKQRRAEERRRPERFLLRFPRPLCTLRFGDAFSWISRPFDLRPPRRAMMDLWMAAYPYAPVCLQNFAGA